MMTMTNLIATAELDIAAMPKQVWQALTDPALIKQYFMGADVETDWKPGSPITWKGEYQASRTKTRVRSSRSYPKSAWNTRISAR